MGTPVRDLLRLSHRIDIAAWSHRKSLLTCKICESPTTRQLNLVMEPISRVAATDAPTTGRHHVRPSFGSDGPICQAYTWSPIAKSNIVFACHFEQICANGLVQAIETQKREPFQMSSSTAPTIYDNRSASGLSANPVKLALNVALSCRTVFPKCPPPSCTEADTLLYNYGYY